MCWNWQAALAVLVCVCVEFLITLRLRKCPITGGLHIELLL